MISPRFIYGTAWKEKDTARCVGDALKAGFRAIDTANQRKHYFEAAVGDALLKAYESGIVARENLFLQTKYTFVRGQDQRLPYDPRASIATQVEQSFKSSQEHLHTEVIDAYILHGPQMSQGLTDEDWEAWEAIGNLKAKGFVREIGVSNMCADQLDELCRNSPKRPRYIQNRCYARLGWDQEVREVCFRHGVQYQGFSLLTANLAILEKPEFAALVRETNWHPAQVVFAYARSLGMIPITGTTNVDHMVLDLKSLQYEFPKPNSIFL